MGGNVSRFFCPEGGNYGRIHEIVAHKKELFCPWHDFLRRLDVWLSLGIVRIYTIFSSSASDEDFFGILPLRLHDAVNGNGGFCSRMAIISVSRKQIGVVLLTASCMSSPKDILGQLFSGKRVLLRP